MNKFDEILNSSDASDALLGEQIDKIGKKAEASDKAHMLRKISNAAISIDLYDNTSYLLTVQSGTEGELYMIYTSTGAAPRICKVASSYSTGTTKLSTVVADDLKLTITPTAWVCCTLVALSLDHVL